MEFLGYELGGILICQLLYFLINFFVGVFLLYIATVLLDFKKRSFSKAAGVLIVGSVVSYLAFIHHIGRYGVLLKKRRIVYEVSRS